MADTGFKLATTTPDPGTRDTWTNPTLAYAEDGSFATYTDPGGAPASNERTQHYGTFDFDIPSTARIDGIEAKIKGKVSTGTYALVIQLRGMSVGSSGAPDSGYPTLTTTNTQYTVGGATDLWGLSSSPMTGADFADAIFHFGVTGKMVPAGSGTVTSIDGIQLKVYYTETSAPTVTTQAVTNISSTTATGNGNVTDDGNATITERGVAWNTTGTPTTADDTATVAGTTGMYAPSMTGLAGGTLYYVRAYAINSVGTSYGSEVTFTTGGFTNPTNAYSSNNSYATVASTTGDITVQLSGDAGANYSSTLTKTYTSSEGSQTYGSGATELWGLTWLGDNVDDTSFRVKVGVGSVYQVYKTFGFAPGASVVLTGIEVSIEAKWDGATTSIDHVKVKIYYGTSTVQVQEGSVAYDTDLENLTYYTGSAWAYPASTAGTLAQFAATTSLQLKGVISDETGSGALVFATSPTLVTPALGTPASGVATNLTGTAAGLTAGTVTTNANLTGEVTSSGNATTIAADVIDGSNINWGATGADAGIWWEELGRTILGSAGDTISVASFTARKYLKILIDTRATGGNMNCLMRFNNDSGGNYCRRNSDNGGADATATGQASIGLTDAVAATPFHAVCEVENVATLEKLVIHRLIRTGTAGTGAAPARREGVAKWVNTSDQITRVDIINDSTGDFAIGSEVVVLGHD